MKQLVMTTLLLMVCLVTDVTAQTIATDVTKFEAVSVSIDTAKVNGRNAIRVIKGNSTEAFDNPTFAKLKDFNFKNGTIEVKVLSRLLKGAPEAARGFIGVTFRIDERNSKFEGIYIRPTNGRIEIQLRRNRATQYFSYPEFKFDRLRKEAPGEYESSANIGLNEWIDLRITVDGSKARLHINGSQEPSLVVNDLKHGPDMAGAIGLWVEFGTEGYFSDLRIQKR